MPCLITALSELNTPRYMTPGGIVDAYQKEIKKITRADLDVADGDIGLKGSPTRVVKTFTKSPKAAGTLVSNLNSQEAADYILEKLKEKFII